MIIKDALTKFSGVTKPELLKKMKTLNDKELTYFKIMLAKSGVLEIRSKPGIAKSAIMKEIAEKMGFEFFDIRLSMVDETDVGLYPTITTIEIDGVMQKFIEHVPPLWAYKANQKPSIIFFEEMNRANLAVRNAALQILLERTIGYNFKFNDNVLMCASGNLGEEDGTDVEEYDAALNNRLIHMKHDLNIKEWKEGFAYEHVLPTIVSFLTGNAEHYYKTKADKDGDVMAAYATPRSWTFLSDYILTNYPPTIDTDAHGKPLYIDENGEFVDKSVNGATPKIVYPNIKEWLPDVKAIGIGYVGASIQRFIRYCEESLRIGVNDVIDRYPEIAEDLKKFNRDKNSELLNGLKKFKIPDWDKKQSENVKNFLLTVAKDELVGYLIYVLDDHYRLNDDSNDKDTKIVKDFIKDPRFKEEFRTIYKHCDHNNENK
jgi:hypothetical protein